MGRLIADVVIVALIILGVVSVVLIRRRGDRQENAVKRLAEAETLIDEISDRCVEMASVGDPTAQTILDDIRSYKVRRRI